MEPAGGFVETESVRLHYVDWGGEGPPLVLVHATGFHARLWDPYAVRLHDRFRVIAIDQRGHGESGMPLNGFDWGHFAEDLHAFIRALGIEGCSAVGHSSGGTAVGVCAGRYPGSIGRVVLIDPVLRDSRGIGFPPGGPNPMAERTRRRRAVWESPHQFEEAMRSRPAFARWRPEYLTLYAHHGLRRRPDHHYELKCRPGVEAQVYEGALTHDPWPALSRLTVPVLLMRATMNESGRVPLPADAVSRIPNCRDLAVSATHFIPMEEPETVHETLEGFLSVVRG
jgi:lipase